MYLIQLLLLDRISPSMTDCLIHKIIHPSISVSKEQYSKLPWSSPISLSPSQTHLQTHSRTGSVLKSVEFGILNSESERTRTHDIVHLPVDSPFAVIQTLLTSDWWLDRLVGSIFHWWTFQKIYWSTNGLFLWTTALEGKKYRKSVDSDLKWWLQMSVNYNNFKIMN